MKEDTEEHETVKGFVYFWPQGPPGSFIPINLPTTYPPLFQIVDRFSAFSSATHADPPTFFTFWETFWPYVAAYLVAYFFQGGSGGGAVGIISNLRYYLWIPIAQNTFRLEGISDAVVC